MTKKHDTEESQRICEAATPGPLTIEEPFDEHISVVFGDKSYSWVFVADFPYGSDYEQALPREKAMANAKAYLHARTALPLANAELREARAEIERLKAQVVEYAKAMEGN